MKLLKPIVCVSLLLYQAALGQDAELQSILKGDEDLRPLIDLTAPSPSTAPEPAKASDKGPRSVLKKAIAAQESAPALPKTQAAPAKQPTGSGLSADALVDLGIITRPNSLVVRGVFVGSPALDAGFKTGDRIIGVDSRPINSASELAEEVHSKVNSQTSDFDISVMRNGRRSVLTISTGSTTNLDEETTGLTVSAPANVGSTAPNAANVRPVVSSTPQSVLRRVSATRNPRRTPETIETPQPVSDRVAGDSANLLKLTEPPTPPAAPRPLGSAEPVRFQAKPSGTSSVLVNPQQRYRYQPNSQLQQAVPRSALNSATQSSARPANSGNLTRQNGQQNGSVQSSAQRYQYYRSQPYVVRAQNASQQVVRPPQQQYVPQPVVRQQRPLVGQGGRLIGNGRLINSARRIIGL